MKFSLVIPCYNEAQNIRLLLNRCNDFQSVGGFELILVNNGSTDNTSEVLAELLPAYSFCRVVDVADNKGYGYGILAGLKAAKGEILGWTHADMQTDPQDVLKAIEIFDRHGADVFVKGRRYGRPIFDVFFTIGMSLFETLLLKKVLWDINAQPTMFSREFYDTWEAPPEDFSLDLYVYYAAKSSRKPVKRFSVYFGERAHGVSHWNVDLRSKWRFILRTLRFSLDLRRRV